MQKKEISDKRRGWLKLDNAAKIYPASKRRNWSNLFRLSFEFDEEIDRNILKDALEVTVKRFPSIAVKLGYGMFWYYLEEVEEAPSLCKETYYPTANMSSRELSKCAFRVIPYKKRLAVEFFHGLTDGTGGLIFIKSLAAEYAERKYGVKIPCERGVLSRSEAPSAEELEDSFIKYVGDVSASRKEATPFHISGTPDKDGFIHLTCFEAKLDEIRAACAKYGASVTVFTTAVMMKALETMQADHIKKRGKRKPVKVLVPVNLRKVFPSKTLRNFAMFVTPEIDPRMGDYNIAEICNTVKHQMAIEVTPKRMSAKFTPNVRSEQMFILKIMPLFIKNIVMRIVFRLYGENKSCICMSNLGALELPDELGDKISRADFILGPQATTKNTCGVITKDDTVYINFVRTTEEPELEADFYAVLRSEGIFPKISSNHKRKEEKDVLH